MTSTDEVRTTASRTPYHTNQLIDNSRSPCSLRLGVGELEEADLVSEVVEGGAHRHVDLDLVERYVQPNGKRGPSVHLHPTDGVGNVPREGGVKGAVVHDVTPQRAGWFDLLPGLIF